MCRDFGVRDPMNEVFQKNVQVANESLPPSEVEKLCQDINAQHGEHIFNPMLRLKGECLSFLHTLINVERR